MNGAREEQNYELQRVIRYGELSPKASRRSGPCVNPVFEGLELFFWSLKTFWGTRRKRTTCCMYNVCNLTVIGPPPARSSRAFPASSSFSRRTGGQLSHPK